MNKWPHIFRALARHHPAFAQRHRMTLTPKGIVFRTAVPTGRGHLFRTLFAVTPDGRIFGPRNRQVEEGVLLAWMNDPHGLDDIL